MNNLLSLQWGRSLEIDSGLLEKSTSRKVACSYVEINKTLAVPESLFGNLSRNNFDTFEIYSSEILDLVEWLGLAAVELISGYTDAPISWHGKLHGYLTSGENMILQIRSTKINSCLGIRYCGAYDSFS
ncbi:hypothetical protein AYI68_g6182 [Smittium mucronatum]|uniref:Uncharacterized protein n=1 Tax=Smittium mucronatum TaxID=133383 RepID=A0A1R0GS80_9FUNG|nr:hypothetical protein AYI68_g6182 [Smittium mucronatum]